MSPSLLSVFGAGLLAAAQVSGPTHSWITDIKANRVNLSGQDVRLEGEVVDVRSTSPSARRGFYRLTDASDPIGVLVRTERIPIDGGSFRLHAKVAVDQVVRGTLLLEEVERDRVDARPLVPVISALASGLVLAILLVLFRRAVTEERQYAVAPPLWLLPDAGPYGKPVAAADGSAGPPALKYEPELEEADRLRRLQLQHRKKSLMRAAVGSLAVTGLSAAWVITTRPVEGQVPAFIFIDSNDPESRASRSQLASADTALTAAAAATIPVDSVAGLRAQLRIDSGPFSPPVRPLPPGGAPASVATTRPVRPDSALARPDSGQTVTPPPPPAPTPAPAPAPPPPPPPPPPEVAAPVRDPAADRARAQSVIQDAAGRLLAAINARKAGDVALLVPEALAGDLGRRERFLKLIREFGPRASLAGVDEATMGDERGEAHIALAFSWRGDFGVDKKKSGRLLAYVRRDGDTWRFEGARLVDAVP
jgi:hypothetical protein